MLAVSITAGEFGREFQGAALGLEVSTMEFEVQNSSEITVRTVISSKRSNIIPRQYSRKQRSSSMHFVAASDSGITWFSQNLLKNAALEPARSLKLQWTDLRFIRVKKFVNGRPAMSDRRKTAPEEMLPGLYSCKAVFLSGVDGKRPDFVLSSNPVSLTVLPQSADHMSEAKQRETLKKLIEELKKGAYGGERSASQLAALGDVSVDALIRIADKKGGGKGFESRVWALTALCANPSPRSDEYIVKRLNNPVELGDLPFLAWNSKACRSPKVKQTIQRLIFLAVKGKELPWQRAHGEIDMETRGKFLEFAFKHYFAKKYDIGTDIVAATFDLPDPKIAAFALAIWKSKTEQEAIRLLAPEWQTVLHPNLKVALLNALETQLKDWGAPVYDKEGNLQRQWFGAGLFLLKQSKDPSILNPQRFLKISILENSRNSELQPPLFSFAGREPAESLKESSRDTLWGWAFDSVDLPKNDKIDLLIKDMRYEDELSSSRKRLILEKLSVLFPDETLLKQLSAIPLEQAWNKGGQFLVSRGYFTRD